MKKRKRHYRIKRKKSVLKNRYFWSVILILVFLGTLTYLIFFCPAFHLKEVRIEGGESIKNQEIRSMVEEQLNEKVLFFSTRNIFFLELKNLQKEILEKFPQIAQLSLARKIPDILSINIQERKPVAVFCQNEKCFFLDKEGIIFEHFSDELNMKDFVSFKKKIDRRLSLGERVVKKEKISKILEIDSSLKKELTVSLEEIIIISQERLNIKTSEGWEIYFNLEEDIEWQLTKLYLVLEEKVSSERRGELEYVDLRFSRIYYKYRF